MVKPLEELNDAGAKLAAKILKIMDEVKSIAKDGTNAHFNYKFASDAAILTAVRGAFIKHKLVAIPSQEACERVGDLTTVKVVYTIIDAETGYSCQATAYGQGQDKGDKGAYKAATGAEKYFLLKALMIPTQDDPEADTATDRPATGTGRPASRPAAAPAPATSAKIPDTEEAQAKAQELMDSFTDAGTFPELEKRGKAYAGDIKKFSPLLQAKVKAAYLVEKKKFQKLEK